MTSRRPGSAQPGARPGASKIVHIRIAQEGVETAARAPSVLPANLAKRQGFAGPVIRRLQKPHSSASRAPEGRGRGPAPRGPTDTPDAQLFRARADACAKGCRQVDVGALTDDSPQTATEPQPKSSLRLARAIAAVRRSIPVWGLNVAVIATAAALYAGPVHGLPPLAHPHLPWWSIAIAFAVAERCVVHLHFRRGAHSFSLGDIPLVFGLIFCSAESFVLGCLLGCGLVLLFDRRLPPVKFVFNMGQLALHACIAILVVHVLATSTGEVDTRTWVSALIATQASAIVASSLIAAAISLSEGVVQAADAGPHARDGPGRDDQQREPRAVRCGDHRRRSSCASAAARPRRRPCSPPIARICPSASGTSAWSSSTRRTGRSRARARSPMP